MLSEFTSPVLENQDYSTLHCASNSGDGGGRRLARLREQGDGNKSSTGVCEVKLCWMWQRGDQVGRSGMAIAPFCNTTAADTTPS